MILAAFGSSSNKTAKEDPLERYPGSSVRLSGENTHTCGYCKGKEPTNVSYGVSAVKLTVADYQALIDLGTLLCHVAQAGVLIFAHRLAALR